MAIESILEAKTKKEATRILTELRGQSFEYLMKLVWQTPIIENNCLRLTTYGFEMMKSLGLASYPVSYTVLTNKQIMQLSRIVSGMYYINVSHPRQIHLFNEKEATFFLLCGDIGVYIDRKVV